MNLQYLLKQVLAHAVGSCAEEPTRRYVSGQIAYKTLLLAAMLELGKFPMMPSPDSLGQ